VKKPACPWCKFKNYARHEGGGCWRCSNCGAGWSGPDPFATKDAKLRRELRSILRKSGDDSVVLDKVHDLLRERRQLARVGEWEAG
jgi:hypothetical protein